MADATTFEEAKRCPKCDMPGEDRSQTPIVDKELRYGKAVVHLIYCVNDRCNWYNTSWSVQVNPDGSIPPPQNHRHGEKKYAQVMNDSETERLLENIQRQLDAEVTDNAEIRRPGQR